MTTHSNAKTGVGNLAESDKTKGSPQLADNLDLTSSSKFDNIRLINSKGEYYVIS